MGISERKERERQKMSHLIVETAMTLYLEGGSANVSIRKIADKIEYSPAAIYLYFKNRDDIFYGLNNLAFEKFYQVLQKLTPVKDPLKRLRKGAEVYIKFAVDNPEYYDLMFIMKAPTRKTHPGQEVVPMGMKAFEFLRNNVNECIEAGCLKQDNPDVLAFAFWAFTHGIATLLIRERLKVFPEKNISSIIHSALDVMMENFTIPS